jgi:hypothetical protein
MMDYSALPLWLRELVFISQTKGPLPAPQYAILWEDPDAPDDPVKVTIPTSEWLAMARHGGILPPVEVYHALAEDEAQPGFMHHTRGHLLHATPPVAAMTESEAMEYLVQMVIPPRVWRDYRGNRPIFRIVGREMVPTDRKNRNAWRIALDQSEAA